MENEGFRLPAEWEHQREIQLTWPHKDTDWAPILDEITAVYVRMAKEIAKRELVLVVAPDIALVRQQLRASLSNEELARVFFFECFTNDTWARDHGFLTLVRGESQIRHCQRVSRRRRKTLVGGKDNEAKELSNFQLSTFTFQNLLLDFCFNGWGEKFPAHLDNDINRQLWEKGVLKGNYRNHLDFVLEGGSIESDGNGTVFTTSQCLLAPHRNQPLSREEIECRLKEYLHADRIVWLDHGNLEGDDTDGHIDTIVRVAPHDTLLYMGCDDESDEQYGDFLALESQLKGLLTKDGHPYRLLRLPMPDAIYDEDGERLPATYANFLILNGAVLVPTYGQLKKDNEALRIIGEAFPDRELVGIDSCTIIKQHGSIHCCTMQLY